jgi:hypothetical protein
MECCFLKLQMLLLVKLVKMDHVVNIVVLVFMIKFLRKQFTKCIK